MEKDKERLSMYISVTKIAIVLCWLSLLAFWALKIFGGNLFEIMVENENFLKFSQAVQNTWLKYLVSFITIFISNYLLLCSIAQQFTFKGKELILVILMIFSMWVVVNFITYISVWYGYLIVIIYGAIKQTKWKRLYGVLGVILTLIFSTVSMLVRDISIGLVTDYLLLMILVIDMYLMMALYYLYSNFLILKLKRRE
ncbi:MAG: hypothetical protein J6J71_04645 [Prevotella sp.]|nr:hypothetical protein [Prevotella sp.]